MFVQVIQGPVTDRDAVWRLGQRWHEELRPGAEGFLGATFGITDDGWLVSSARFENEEVARRNSDKPEQGAWWNEFAKCFSAEPTFIESTDVELILGGGKDTAQFVQVMSGKVRDRAALKKLEDEVMPRMGELRPDYIGGVRLWHGDDEYVDFAYFTNEAEAREGEKKPPPEELQDNFGQWQDVVGDVTYRDLREVRTY